MATAALQPWTGSRNPKWTDAEVDELKRLGAIGLSGGQIASEMGKTRSAILGKVYRLGLSMGKLSPVQTPEERRAARNEYQRQYSKEHKRVRPPAVKKLPPAVPVPVKTGPLNIPLLKLKPRQCRQPYGDNPPFVFCGQRTAAHMSYCAEHARLNYVPLKSRSDYGRVIATW